MFSRRKLLTGTAVTSVALATQCIQPAVAQPAQKRLIVDSRNSSLAGEHTGAPLGGQRHAAAAGTVHHRAGSPDDG